MLYSHVVCRYVVLYPSDGQLDQTEEGIRR
jgi:hypothetical protein